MPERDHRAGLFPALLKHWRGRRGLSQLDLALAADVSARHLSFLETGRSNPSADMILRIAATLGVPLRHVNAMLAAAGHEAVYDEAEPAVPSAVTDALTRLKEHHEPYPLVVVDRLYELRDLNRGAMLVLGTMLGGALPTGAANLAKLTFDPDGAQPVIANFDEVGRHLLWRIQREVLADPDDPAMLELLDELLAMPTVKPDWRQVDLSVASDPVLVIHLRAAGLDLRFLTMVTAFQAPQNLVLEDLRVEQWLPWNEATATACRQLAGLSEM